MSDTLTIDQIRSKLRAGELFLKEKQGGRSDVWGKFSELVDLDDKMIGFQEFAQELVNIDSVYGPLSIDELLPNLQQYHVVHLLLDYYRKISYISLTVHYIDGWSLREQVLAVSKFSDTNSVANFVAAFRNHSHLPCISY
ncbi:973_t:CDS:2, partial [Entrophospora sp. SA101]